LKEGGRRLPIPRPLVAKSSGGGKPWKKGGGDHLNTFAGSFGGGKEGNPKITKRNGGA